MKRENEIAQVKQLLEASRLVTLLGSGGSGKTQLAIATTARLFDQFSDGVWLVGFELCKDPA